MRWICLAVRGRVEGLAWYVWKMLIGITRESVHVTRVGAVQAVRNITEHVAPSASLSVLGLLPLIAYRVPVTHFEMQIIHVFVENGGLVRTVQSIVGSVTRIVVGASGIAPITV